MTGYDNLAKVLKASDQYEVVINRGSQNGVEIGDVYLIFEVGEHLIDPDTGEDLGALEIVRGRARVVHVQEKMATLESSETYSQPGVKKTIRRDSGRALSIFGMAATEEVQESQPPKLKALGAMVGDRARPV